VNVASPLSCPGQSAERRTRTKRDPGPSARIAKRNLLLRVRPPGSGSRCARPGHERGRATSRRAHEPLAVVVFTMSNSAVLFVPAARCCARVCPSLRRCLHSCVRRASPRGLWRQRPSRLQQFRPPDEGWMERRQTHSLVSVAPATRDHPVPGRPGPLSALHRGDFGYGPTKPAPAVEPEPAATARARHCRPAVGVRTSPRCGSRRSGGRHSWLRLSGSFLENAPLSQDTNRCIINAIRSQYLIRVVVDTCISAREGAARPAERRNVPA
jgi:hypothetical protein